MASQNTTQSFGYTWGFADNSRGESVVEISPNINYSMPYLQLSDGSNIIIQKDPKGTITHTNKGTVRRIVLANDTSMIQGTTQRVITTGGTTTVAHHKKHDVLSMACDKNCSCSEGTTSITPIFTTANGLIDGKGQTILTTSSKPTHFMSPIGPLQLTAEECNEILMKRAAAAATQQHSLTSDGHHSISVQVQKVIQGLEEDNDSQCNTTHLKIEPNLEISPKIEQIEFFPQEIQSDHHNGTMQSAATKERPYSCEQCGKSFLLKHHLTTHARVHTGERPHVCPHCQKDFAHKHCLNTHLLLHSSDRPFSCVECKKSFTLKHHLLTHSRVHSRSRPFVCQECGKSFPLKRHLVTHSKFHAGERPFICEVCGESFAQKDHLVMHSRFHGSTNPFVCNDCGVTFPRKFQLVNHQKEHGKIPHSCTVCGKEFLQKRTLQAHMRLHTGDTKPFPCITCGAGFRTKSELNQHNRVTHSVNNNNNNNNNTNSTTTIIPVSITQTVTQQSQNQHHHHHPQQQQQTLIQPQIQQIQVQQIQQNAQQVHQTQHQQQTVEIQTIPHHQTAQQTVTVVSGNPNLIQTTLTSPQEQPTPRYSCRECNSAFNSKEALALHLRLHTGDKSLMTDLCALTAAIPGHFLQGSLNTVPTSPVPVQLISSSGQVITQATIAQSSPIQQQQHIQHQHQPQQQTVHQIQTQPQTTIVSGNQNFTLASPQQHGQSQPQQTVVVHTQPMSQQIHQTQKPKSHFCGHCGKGFAAKHGLLLHNKRHPNGGCTMRSHVCECGKAFFQKNHLMLHQRQHIDQKPNIIQLQQQVNQNEVIVTQAQQIHQSNSSQNQLSRNVVIANTPMQLQVLQDNPTQVIKYEIIQHESRNAIE